jgi:hypothetical protein
MFGTFRVDELVLPVVDVRLGSGAILVTVDIAVTDANEAYIRAVRPGMKVMLYGEDGGLIVRGAVGDDEWPEHVLARLRVGDGVRFTYKLVPRDRLTDEVRAVAS